MQTDYTQVYQLIGTLFQGGIFVVIVGIAWKGATFVQWVRSAFVDNAAGHVRIEIAIGKVDKRVNNLEDKVGKM